MSVVAASGAHIPSRAIADLEAVITPIQLELLALYASGYSYAEIATIKFMSPYSVRNRLALARERSGARNLTHLSVALYERGLIRRDSEGGHFYVPVQDLRIASE